MKQNTTLLILFNISLYTALLMTMTYMIGQAFFLELSGSIFLNTMLAISPLVFAFSILDFRNKIFEGKTFWSENLRLIFYINLLLSAFFSVFAFIVIMMPIFSIKYGLWVRGFDKFGDTHYITNYYFHPILGIIGTIITLCTFCNIKYRLNKADYRKIFIELLPIFAVGFLIFCHYNYIPKPYIKG